MQKGKKKNSEKKRRRAGRPRRRRVHVMQQKPNFVSIIFLQVPVSSATFSSPLCYARLQLRWFRVRAGLRLMVEGTCRPPWCTCILRTGGRGNHLSCKSRVAVYCSLSRTSHHHTTQANQLTWTCLYFVQLPTATNFSATCSQKREEHTKWRPLARTVQRDGFSTIQSGRQGLRRTFICACNPNMERKRFALLDLFERARSLRNRTNPSVTFWPSLDLSAEYTRPFPPSPKISKMM